MQVIINNPSLEAKLIATSKEMKIQIDELVEKFISDSIEKYNLTLNQDKEIVNMVYEDIISSEVYSSPYMDGIQEENLSFLEVDIKNGLNSGVSDKSHTQIINKFKKNYV